MYVPWILPRCSFWALSLAGLVLHVIQFLYPALNWRPVVWLGKIS
jgi:hypothetical protein